MPDLAHRVSALCESRALLDQAERCRRLARQSTDRRTVKALASLAAECEAKAMAMRGRVAMTGA